MNAQQLFDKAPPSAPEAELALLGGIMMGGNPLPLGLEAIDFSDERNGKIFHHLCAIWPAHDIIAIKDRLEKTREFGILGIDDDFIASLKEQVPSTTMLPHHCKIVKEVSRRRKLIDALLVSLAECQNQRMMPMDDIQLNVAGRIAAIVPASTHQGLLDNSPAADEGHAQAIYDLTPKEIRVVFHALKNPDGGRKGLKLSDPCLLLLAYALVGSLIGKRLVVRNNYMSAKSEHFYPNNFVFFVNRSGSGKSGSTGLVQEFIETFNRSLDDGSMKIRVKTNMAAGPKGLIEETFGIHAGRIKERTVGTGPVLPPLANARKDAPERRAITQEDSDNAKDAYVANLWEHRDRIKPITFVVDELAEKFSAIAHLSNDTLISIHSSGPHNKAELSYNNIGVCYGYGHAISIFGNMQTKLVGDLLYTGKNSSSGLLGRILPLCNDFQAHTSLPDHEGALEDTAEFLGRDIGRLHVNEVEANYTGEPFKGFKDRFTRPNGIEPEKIYVMAQRLMAPAVLFGEEMNILFAHACELLSQLYEDAYTRAITSGAQEAATRSNAKVEKLVKDAIQACPVGGRINIRDLYMTASSSQRDYVEDAVLDQMGRNSGFEAYGNHRKKVAGFVRRF